MSTSVMQPQGFTLTDEPVQIMAPSAITPVSPRARHGRGKSGSFSRGRALSNAGVDDREVMISKALTWVLRRGMGEKREEMGITIHFDEEGWADCGEVLQWPNLSALSPSLADLQILLATQPQSRHRFSLQLKEPSLDAALASSYLIRATSSAAFPLPQALGTRLTIDSEELPELVVYATTYATYAHIISSGTLRNMGGGNIQFLTAIPEDSDSKAEVIFYIDIHAALSSPGTAQELEWYISPTTQVITVAHGNSVPKSLWKKVVGRKGDLGTLWENGEVVRDVPMGIRGKKVDGGKGRELKGRNGKGKGGNGKGTRKSWSGDEE